MSYPKEFEELAGGIKVRYRKSCGMCRNSVELKNAMYCNKAFKLDNDRNSLIFIARGAIETNEARIDFNTKYSVAPNTVCEEYFEPVSNRFVLD